MADLTRAERDDLIAHIDSLWQRLLAEDDSPSHLGRRTYDAYLEALAEYADRLPRWPVSACPATGAVLKRTIDPWGLDGYFWHAEPVVAFAEPKAPPGFQVIQGGLDLQGRPPKEAITLVQPGPAAPFVIPNLMRLPGMRAVLSRIRLATGDLAYLTTYWSDEALAPEQLHGPWLRTTYHLPGGGWSICTDPWDFALRPWLDQGRLMWIAPEDPDWTVRSGTPGCPYLDLPGHQGQQFISQSALDQTDPPDGKAVMPFEG